MAMIKCRSVLGNLLPVPPPSLVSFTTGTDAEITDMIEAYYDDVHSLNNIQIQSPYSLEGEEKT